VLITIDPGLPGNQRAGPPGCLITSWGTHHRHTSLTWSWSAGISRDSPGRPGGTPRSRPGRAIRAV